MMAAPVVVFAAIAGLFLWGMGRDDPDALRSTLIGREVPGVGAATLAEAAQLTPEMLHAPGIKLVNFWASWCPPCRAEHPTLTTLSRELPVYGISLKDPEANAAAFLAEHGDPFAAQATDPRGRTAIDWGVTAPPETFIVDGTGRVLYRFAGPLIGDDYAQRFLPELAKARAQE